MTTQLTLGIMNGAFAFPTAKTGLHSPHVQITMTELQEVWSGAYDAETAIAVLHREGQRLLALADAIEKNVK